MHINNNDSERQRILDAGGNIYNGRVSGLLAVTCAFADGAFKKPELSENFVTVVVMYQKNTLISTCKYIILACDATKQCNSLDETARLLTSYALDKGNRDNITVEVIRLDWRD